MEQSDRSMPCTPFTVLSSVPASFASVVRIGLSWFVLYFSFTMSPVSTNSPVMLVQLNRFRKSANTDRSREPRWKPRVSLRSTFLIHGDVDEFSGSAGLATRPKVLPGPVVPVPCCGKRV